MLNVTLREWSRSDAEARDAPTHTERPRRTIPADLGLGLAALPDEDRAKYGLAAGQSGVVVTGVAAGTDAAEQAVAAGDLILRVGDSVVLQPAEVWQGVEAAHQRRDGFVLALILPGTVRGGGTISRPVPRWVPLRITDAER